ncbi:RNase adapter RapZ [Fructilactobacillus vespulae]|uniref:RNase adapter RapZ n=1 Tax=Fructilactobacillus vespulae TaxID=1249630 RepID=UPI0039B67C22
MVKDEQLVIITGMSGAGKSCAIQTFEDLGYFCVDNLPPNLVYKFTELLRTSSEINKVALVIDSRAPGSGKDVVDTLVKISTNNNKNESVIFLDASTAKIVSRYEETRRDHPLARNGRLVDGIEKERQLLRDVRTKANLVIDTTKLTNKQLKEEIINQYENSRSETFHVELMSFGFKYGLPIDADMLFDVRFINNPYYVAELRNQTGKDQPVYDYVMKQDAAEEFFAKLDDLVKFEIPLVKHSSKASETIAIGCTGGQHRSVAMTERLAASLREQGIRVNVTHRDIDRHKGVNN